MHSHMLFFKKILNFSKEAVKDTDKREATRYAVGNPFPFKSIITLIGHDGEGHIIPGDDKGQDWSGRLSNLSATGASMQMNAAAMATRGEPCKFKLSLGEYLLEIPGTVAHLRNCSQYVLCGVAFKFPDFNTQKAYLQVLEPVSIGASLEPVETKAIKPDSSGLQKEQYRNAGNALLNVWRPAPGGEIHRFDFRMNDFGVRWGAGMAELETYGIDSANSTGKKDEPPAIRKLTETQHEEVRWLFCLAVPNLAKAVPSDVRKFLGKLVAT